jgi:hypothetical protein
VCYSRNMVSRFAFTLLSVSCVSDDLPPGQGKPSLADAGVGGMEAGAILDAAGDAPKRPNPPSLEGAACNTDLQSNLAQEISGWAKRGNQCEFTPTGLLCSADMNSVFGVYQGPVLWTSSKFGVQFSASLNVPPLATGSVIIAQLGVDDGKKVQLELQRVGGNQAIRLQWETGAAKLSAEAIISKLPLHTYKVWVQPALEAGFNFVELIVDNQPAVSLRVPQANMNSVQLGPYLAVQGVTAMASPSILYTNLTLVSCP